MDIFDSTDMHGQSRILPTLKAVFSGCPLQIEQHYEDKGGVDMYITATTKNNKEVWYAIECKDRKMHHIGRNCIDIGLFENYHADCRNCRNYQKLNA